MGDIMRLLVLFFIIFLPVSISAGELLNSYLPKIRIAKDWKRISWVDQVKIADEIALDAGLSERSGSSVNACLDMAAEDVRL
jgi:hypothetical protein